MSTASQLPLGVQLREPPGFDTFCTGSNAEAVRALRALASGRGALYLHGGAGCGKSHLLHALVRAAGDSGRRAVYLDLQSLRRESPALLEGLEEQDVIALDALEGAFLQRDWTLGVLRLLDATRARGKALALAARLPPAHVDCVLADLATRLSSCAVFGLHLPDDEDRARWMQERARARGLEIGDDVARLLIQRLPRSSDSLLNALDTLDRAALSAQRRLTAPFVRQILQL